MAARRSDWTWARNRRASAGVHSPHLGLDPPRCDHGVADVAVDELPPQGVLEGPTHHSVAHPDGRWREGAVPEAARLPEQRGLPLPHVGWRQRAQPKSSEVRNDVVLDRPLVRDRGGRSAARCRRHEPVGQELGDRRSGIVRRRLVGAVLQLDVEPPLRRDGVPLRPVSAPPDLPSTSARVVDPGHEGPAAVPSHHAHVPSVARLSARRAGVLRDPLRSLLARAPRSGHRASPGTASGRSEDRPDLGRHPARSEGLEPPTF